MPNDVVRKSAIVSYEAEINIVSYAKKGILTLTVTPKTVEIEVTDEGPGIPDIEQAMEARLFHCQSADKRNGVRRRHGTVQYQVYSDKFDISSEVDKGTFLKMIIIHS